MSSWDAYQVDELQMELRRLRVENAALKESMRQMAMSKGVRE